MRAPEHWSQRDLLWCAAVTGLTTVYIAYIWPKILVGLDEGPFIYEAKRVLDGEVMYRDFFDLTGPLAQHLLALMYAVAGVSMETARGCMALLHGVMAVLMYAIMRRLAVRPSLAAVCCLVDLALFYPAFAMASSHWFSTTFTVLVFWFVLREPLRTPRRAFAAGLLTALVALTLQPKGVATALAVAIVLLRDAWAARDSAPGPQAFIRQLSAYGAGLASVLFVTLGFFVVVAGWWPVFDALVVQPLGPYRSNPFVDQGHWMPLGIDTQLLLHMIAIASTFLILNVMPLIVPLSAARLILRMLKRDGSNLRPLFVAVTFAASAIVSVAYQPNHSHFAIVGPIWLPLYGELLERMTQRLERRWPRPVTGPIAVAAVLALVVLRVQHDLPRAWTSVGATSRTAFGTVHVGTKAEGDEIDALAATLSAAGAQHIFVYPSAPAVYLMTATSNPTRFQLLLPGYNTVAQFREVQEVLERQRVPFVVRSFYWWGRPDQPSYRPDLLRPYLDAHYEPVSLPHAKGTFATLSLLRRKADAPAASSSMGSGSF